MYEKLEAYLDMHARRDKSGDDAFRLDENGMYVHLDTTSADPDYGWSYDGYTIELGSAGVNEAKKLVAQELGREPGAEELAGILRSAAQRRLAGMHHAKQKSNNLIAYTVFLAIGAVTLSGAMDSASVFIGILTLIAIMWMIAYMQKDGKFALCLCAALAVLAGSVFWLAWDMDVQGMQPFKRAVKLTFGSTDTKVQAMYEDMSLWDHDVAVALFSSMEPEKAADYLKSPLQASESRLRHTDTGGWRMEYYIDSYGMEKVMPAVVELADKGFFSQEQYEELAEIFLRRYPLAQAAFEEDEEQLFQSALDKCSDAFLGLFYLNPKSRTELPETLQEYLTQRLGEPVPLDEVYWVKHAGISVAPEVLCFYGSSIGFSYSLAEGSGDAWLHGGVLNPDDLQEEEMFRWEMKSLASQRFVELTRSGQTKRYEITAEADMEGTGLIGITLTMENGSSGQWVKATQ